MLQNLLTYFIKDTENRLLLILKVIGIFYVNPSTVLRHHVYTSLEIDLDYAPTVYVLQHSP
jgi:hypothetical protein